MAGLKKTALGLATAGLLSGGMGHAALHDRGGGLLYDDVLNVTWLQDANYAKTSGYDADGRMSWEEANKWAENLVYHDSLRNVDYTDWRLPTLTAESIHGFQNRSQASELSYMWYVNLEGKTFGDPRGMEPYEPFGICTDNCREGFVNPVKNLQSGDQELYWSSTAGAPWSTDPDPATNQSYNVLLIEYGFQQDMYHRYEQYAWAVRDQDVGVIPEPETYAMLLAGLGLLGFIARRHKSRQPD